MSWFSDREKRNFIGSIFYILLVVGVVTFFGINTVPTENKDFVVSICTVLTSGALLAIYQLIGRDPNELEALKQENELLRTKNKGYEERIQQLEKMFIDLQGKVISRLSELTNK